MRYSSVRPRPGPAKIPSRDIDIIKTIFRMCRRRAAAAPAEALRYRQPH
ncbi:hypothetical protein T261_0508 [Streptomyces lydicus]|nr:hypothetical protein T261_0508 [Streptomyces lydicus]